MKILQINAVNKISSTGRNVSELNAYLESKGDLCVSAFSKGVSANPSAEYVIGNALDEKLHALLSRVTGKQGYFSKRATRDLVRFMESFAPDAVILNNLHANYINLPILLDFLAKKDIPTVCVLHDCWPFTGKCCHYTAKGCYKWKTECGDCPALSLYNKSWFFDKTREMQRDKIRLFGSIPRLAVVGVSDWITNEAKASPVFKNAKVIKRIYNWIDTDVFSQKDTDVLRFELGLEGKRVLLCVASGWTKEKGIDTVITLSKKLSDNERLVVVGNTDVRFNRRVIHIPATDSVETLASLYSLADVFIQPSLEETFGKVSAEALACGTPIVTFDTTASPELVGDNCGAVVRAGDTDAMLLKIREILQNGKDKYSDSCRSFARENFEKTHCLEMYETLIKSL